MTFFSKNMLFATDGARNLRKHPTPAFWTFTSFLLLCWMGTVTSPVVQWETPTEHDFGDVYMNKPARYAFVFRNTTDQPIVLQTVRTTCGCTAAEWPETPVAPGETGEVKIDFEGYQKGAFRKKIRVFFDKQKGPEILWVSGVVR